VDNNTLDVEKNPAIRRFDCQNIIRALHTIKGSSGMFGYDEITMFTHDIETVYDFIRNGTLAITKHIIDLTLEACDQISLMLKNEKLSQDEENVTKKIIASFRGIVADFNKNSNDENKNTSKSKSDISLETGIAETYLISFVPSPQIFISGTNPLMLINEMTELGEAIVLANFDSLPTIESINPEKCYVSWDVILKTNKGIDAIKDVFIFVDDDGGLKIDLLDKSGKLAKEEDFKDFESLLISVSKTKRPDIKNLFAEYQNSAKINDSSVQNLKSKKGGKEAGESTTETDSASSIRVSAEKLDELVNLVGELVTVQARLSQLATTSTDQNVAVISEEVERITWSLRDSALNIRMLPIGTTFSKFKRLVRDLSKELGKQVELSTEGAETELDKTVLEKLNDPLVHIIRNSIDHGVEKPSDREMKGKYPVGSVKLSASQSGGNVIIKISDDGAGIDKEAVKNKAINMGLINENSNLSDSDIYGLIFAAGFSTAKKVTNVSGRGVGMDVVRRAIESLRGSIEVTSKLNEGTTISLKLPLTLAI
jgi:two-component system chemotaxis sensor kinase CheA